MKLDDLTLGDVKQLRGMLGSDAVPPPCPHPYEFQLGTNYFVRTVTHHYVGTCVAVTKDALFLMPCAWVSDDGRFGEAMATGKLNEVEVWPKDVPVRINLGSFCDSSPWKHGVPAVSK